MVHKGIGQTQEAGYSGPTIPPSPNIVVYTSPILWLYNSRLTGKWKRSGLTVPLKGIGQHIQYEAIICQ